MKKWLKALLIIIGILALIGGSVLGIIKIQEYREAEKEKVEQEKIAETYWEVNFSVGMAAYKEHELIMHGKYQPFPIFSEEQNKYGINSSVYLYLKMYESRTGTTLPYETVVEYFSKEKEPDGSLRLYNNGLHPEMEAYVEWIQGRRDEMTQYVRTIQDLYGGYVWENRGRGFISQKLSALSPQMLDELAKKEADPNYEMDLLSLQQQGY